MNMDWEQRVDRLAELLWIGRGRPMGSPDIDRVRALIMVKASKRCHIPLVLLDCVPEAELDELLPQS